MDSCGRAGQGVAGDWQGKLSWASDLFNSHGSTWKHMELHGKKYFKGFILPCASVVIMSVLIRLKQAQD